MSSPDTVILLIVDYHATIGGGKTHVAPSLRTPLSHLAEVDKRLATVMILVVQTIVRRLQPAVPLASPRLDSRVRPERVYRRKVAAARYVVLRRLEGARPEVLEILDAVLSVGFSVVELHCRQMTGVTARSHNIT